MTFPELIPKTGLTRRPFMQKRNLHKTLARGTVQTPVSEGAARPFKTDSATRGKAISTRQVHLEVPLLEGDALHQHLNAQQHQSGGADSWIRP